MSALTGKVQTVLGLIEPSELGPTLPHEHLLVNLVPPEMRGEPGEAIILENVGRMRRHWNDNPAILILDNEEEAVKELAPFKKIGGGTIVDLSVIGISRYPEGLARISQASGVHVVMGSGYYSAAYHPLEIADQTEEDVAEMIACEFTSGVADSGIRPGLIGEIGLDWPVHENEVKVLRGAVMAQKETGASLNIHPGRAPEAPLDAIRIVQEAGADADRVIMSHIDRTLFSLEAILELAETGCYLEWDLFGQEMSFYPMAPIEMPNDATRIDYLIKLIELGFRDRLLVSTDICKKTQFTRYGGEGYAYLLENVLPMMKDKGLSDEDIHALTVENPVRMLTVV